MYVTVYIHLGKYFNVLSETAMTHERHDLPRRQYEYIVVKTKDCFPVLENFGLSGTSRVRNYEGYGTVSDTELWVDTFDL